MDDFKIDTVISKDYAPNYYEGTQDYKCPKCHTKGEFPNTYKKEYVVLNLRCSKCGIGLRFKFGKATI